MHRMVTARKIEMDKVIRGRGISWRCHLPTESVSLGDIWRCCPATAVRLAMSHVNLTDLCIVQCVLMLSSACSFKKPSCPFLT